MKHIILLTLLLTACQSPRVDLLSGQRNFDGAEWEQTDNQTGAFGVQMEFCDKDGVGVEIGFIGSEDRSQDPVYVNRSVNEVTTNVQEVYFGLKKNFMLSDRWQFMFSSGVSSLTLDTEVNLSYRGGKRVFRDTDTAYAPYLQVGTRFFLTDNLAGGILYRHSFLNKEADIFTTHPDLDGHTFLLTVGWSF